MNIQRQPRSSGEPISIEQAASTVSHHCAELFANEVPYGGLDIEEPTAGYIYTDRNQLCIEHLAKIPTETCIKSSQPAKHTVQMYLRSPLEPDSWWGRCPRKITIGLSSGEYFKHWLVSGVAKLGLLVALAGFWAGLFINPWFCAGGIAVFLASSVLNAMSPVWYGEVSRELTTLNGVCRDFLKHYNRIDHHNASAGTQPAQLALPHHSSHRNAG